MLLRKSIDNMSIKSVNSYSYQPKLELNGPFFEINAIQLDKSCIANENEVSKFFKIYWIEEGSGTYEIDFKQFKIQNSGLFFLSPGQILTVKSEKVKTGYQISFDKDFYCVETHGKAIACNGILFNNVHRATFISLQKEDTPIFQNLVSHIIEELDNPGVAHQAMVESYLRMFLIHALRKYDQQQPDMQRGKDDSHQLVADFIALIEKHFKTIHSVSDYADKLFISPKSLSKRLHSLGYPTPTQMIRDRIMLQAKRSLKFSNKSIKEIAFDLGFEDPGYFTRLFKKETSQSPQVYRETNVNASMVKP